MLDEDPLRRKKPHIFLDREEDTSTQTSAPVESEPLVWPTQQQGPRGEEDQVARSSAQREQLKEEGREAERSLMKKREKHSAKSGSLQNTSTDSKGATFVILKNHASAPI